MIKIILFKNDLLSILFNLIEFTWSHKVMLLSFIQLIHSLKFIAELEVRYFPGHKLDNYFVTYFVKYF